MTDRQFGPYFGGNLLSNCGTWFQNLAQSLLVYRLTGSTFYVGVVNFAQFAGTLALAPWAGVAADTFDRRKLLVVTQLGAVAVSAVLAILSGTGHVNATIVIVLALVLGATTAFAVPALQALVPLLVERRDLGTAVALNAVTFNLARAIGPLLGAAVIHGFGITAAIALNSVSYLALVLALLVIRPSSQGPAPSRRPKFRESVALLRSDRDLAVTLAFIAAISLTSDPVNTLTPAYAETLLHRADEFAGVLIGAFGLGSVAAAFLIVPRLAEPRRRMVRSATVLGLGMVAFGLAPGLVAALVVLVLAGAGFLTANTTATTTIQLGVEDSLRGRVMALWTVAFLGVRPLGSIIDGAIASAVGVRAAAVMMGAPAIAGALLVRSKLARVRQV